MEETSPMRLHGGSFWGAMICIAPGLSSYINIFFDQKAPDNIR